MNDPSESTPETVQDESVIDGFLEILEGLRNVVPVINDKQEVEAAKQDAEEEERLAAHRNKMGEYEQQKNIRNHQMATIYWIKRCTFWWMIAVLFFLFCSSIQTDDMDFWGWKIKAFTIDSSVAIAFITTTTANVLGGLWIVMHWLYKK